MPTMSHLEPYTNPNRSYSQIITVKVYQSLMNSLAIVINIYGLVVYYIFYIRLELTTLLSPSFWNNKVCSYFFIQSGEQEELTCKNYLTQIRDLRLRLEGCENQTVTHFRRSMGEEPLKTCASKTAAQKVLEKGHRQPKVKCFKRPFNMLCSCFSLSVHKIICSPWQKVQTELDDLKEDLNSLTEKVEEILASPQQASSSPMLRSELDITLKKMDHVHGLSSIYLDKWGFLTHLRISVTFRGLCKDYVYDFRLKSIEGVIRNTKEAKDTLMNYENRLRDIKKVPADEKELEDHQKMLKVFLLFVEKRFILHAASSFLFQSDYSALLPDSRCMLRQ